MSSAVADRSWAAPPTGLPRLLAGVSPEGRQASLEHHLAAYGAAPHAGPELIDLVERSGLRGRGGGGFPTGRKLAAVASQGGRPVVVVNAAEGEPASSKDRMLVRYVPHLVLDGAVLAADALGARRAIVALGGSELDLRALADAIDARARRRVDRHVELVPVAAPRGVRRRRGDRARPLPERRPGEADVHAAAAVRARRRRRSDARAERRDARAPRPDRPFRAGVVPRARHARRARVRPGLAQRRGRPGPACTRSSSGRRSPSCCAARAGESEPLRAFLVGGYFGSWLDSSRIDIPLSDAALVPLGASLGARAIVALPKEACGLVETARVARYLAAESAGQCGPCVNGLDAIAGGLVRLASRERRQPGRPPPLGRSRARTRRLPPSRRRGRLRRERPHLLRGRGGAPSSRPL